MEAKAGSSSWKRFDTILKDYSARVGAEISFHYDESFGTDTARLTANHREWQIQTRCAYSLWKMLSDIQWSHETGKAVCFLGSVHARFSNRIFSLCGDAIFQYTDTMGFKVPKSWVDMKDAEDLLHQFCQTLLSLGYNAVELELSGSSGFDESEIKWIPILNICKEWGLNVCLNVHLDQLPISCPAHPKYRETVKEQLQPLLEECLDIHSLRVTSNLASAGYMEGEWAEIQTSVELLELEKKTYESLMNQDQQLIFYLPYSHWCTGSKAIEAIQVLTQHSSSNTLISFPAEVRESKQMHPIWSINEKQLTRASLIPVFDLSHMTIPMDLYRKTLLQMDHSKFQGGIFYSSYWSSKIGCPYESIEIAGQMMWRKLDPSLFTKNDLFYKEELSRIEMLLGSLKDPFKEREQVQSLACSIAYHIEYLFQSTIDEESRICLKELDAVLRTISEEKRITNLPVFNNN